MNLVQRTMGGETTHLEFESRGGVPTYEFIVQSEAGPTYYVGCDATTRLIGEVDVIVDTDDERFASVAQLTAQEAADIATQRFPGDVEEVKSLLLSTGRVAYEVDVEIEPNGEFNVYVDAETGEILTVTVEYFEIGQSGTEADQLGGTGAEPGASGGAGDTYKRLTHALSKTNAQKALWRNHRAFCWLEVKPQPGDDNRKSTACVPNGMVLLLAFCKSPDTGGEVKRDKNSMPRQLTKPRFLRVLQIFRRYSQPGCGVSRLRHQYHYP